MHGRSLSYLLLIAGLLLVASFASAQINFCNGISLGQEGSLNGFIPFPSSSLWNTNIANAQVDPNSAAIINFIGESTPLHPDFGSGLYDGQTIGIPYIVVPGTQPPGAPPKLPFAWVGVFVFDPQLKISRRRLRFDQPRPFPRNG